MKKARETANFLSSFKSTLIVTLSCGYLRNQPTLSSAKQQLMERVEDSGGGVGADCPGLGSQVEHPDSGFKKIVQLGEVVQVLPQQKHDGKFGPPSLTLHYNQFSSVSVFK